MSSKSYQNAEHLKRFFIKREEEAYPTYERKHRQSCRRIINSDLDLKNNQAVVISKVYWYICNYTLTFSHLPWIIENPQTI